MELDVLALVRRGRDPLLAVRLADDLAEVAVEQAELVAADGGGDRLALSGLHRRGSVQVLEGVELDRLAVVLDAGDPLLAVRLAGHHAKAAVVRPDVVPGDGRRN